MKLAQILRIARSGSHELAWSSFVAGGWLERTGDARALTLMGRLLKDRAKRQDGRKRLETLARSAAAYQAAADLGPATYPLINAATLALLAGRRNAAAELAQRTLDLLERGGYEPETQYWLAATRAEALLLLDRTKEAKTALTEALTNAPRAWEDHAATIGQFGLILAEQGKDADWLDAFRPPKSMHFQGIMGITPDDTSLAGPIGERLDAIGPGFGFGALAAGADILVAEALVRRGAELHVALPCPPGVFRDRSVTTVDAEWGPRFDALLEAAATVETIGTSPRPSRAAVRVCEEAAMGLALRNARILASEAVSLCVTDSRQTLPASARAWRQGGRRVETIVAERSAKAPESENGASLAPVALASLDRDASATPEPPSDWQIARNGRTVHGFAEPAALPGWLTDMARRADPGDTVALDYGLAEGTEAEPHLLDRLAALAQIAQTGQTVASRAMAMALELYAPALRIEAAGEMRWAGGTAPFFSIIAG